MLLISLETAVPLSPSKSPSLAVELAVDRPILPRAFHHRRPSPGLEIKRPAMRRTTAPLDVLGCSGSHAAALCIDANSLLSNGKPGDARSRIGWHRVAI
jgi:hypothetical protein